ncbi:MAG: hypothetical protein IKY53_04315, partial [Lachnospiraceae bacterium]|nr:hypothetical protein [Lachnospiraceae bacterium]
MADLKKMILEELRKSPNLQTETINEMEEYIDTGLEKTEENIIEVALNYLDEKGYRRRADNLEYAKQMILSCSEDYDTIIVKRKQVVEEDLFENASMNELRDALNLCILNNLNSIQDMVEYLIDVKYEYKVETLLRLYTEDDRPRGHLASDDFETFEELLNRYAD